MLLILLSEVPGGDHVVLYNNWFDLHRPGIGKLAKILHRFRSLAKGYTAIDVNHVRNLYPLRGNASLAVPVSTCSFYFAQGIQGKRDLAPQFLKA